MAISGDGPSATPISQERLKASLRRTEQRLANSRARRSRQQRNVALAIIAVSCVLLAVSALIRARREVPPAPLLLVTWPKPKLQQKLPGGSTVLARPGQSFRITVDNAAAWTLQWHSADVTSKGPTTLWSPTASNSTLTVYCRATATGWRRIVSWLWPTRTVSLTAQVGSATKFHYEIAPPRGGLWVYPLIYADRPVHWDERALPQLMQATWLMSPRLATAPSQPLWTLVPSFETQPAGAKPAAADPGTYARLWSAQPQDDLPRLCRLIAQVNAGESIKYIVRLRARNKQQPEGILRVAFDGKAQRGGWVKSADQSTAEVVEWWNAPSDSTAISPAPPRR